MWAVEMFQERERKAERRLLWGTQKLFSESWNLITREQRGWNSRKGALGANFQKILGNQQRLAGALKFCPIRILVERVCVGDLAKPQSNQKALSSLWFRKNKNLLSFCVRHI